MTILYTCGKRKIKKIIKMINHYWYDECRSSIPEKERMDKIKYNHTVFSCEHYTFSISSYSMNIWYSEELTEEEKEEIRNIFNIIFLDDNGNAEKFSGFYEYIPQNEWFADLLKSYPNLSRSSTGRCHITEAANVHYKDIDECIDFVNNLDGNDDMKSKLLSILNAVKNNN